VGALLFLAGSALILVLRPMALKNELEATITTMVGVIADAEDKLRRWVMERRVKTLASMPTTQRDKHVKLMMVGLGQLPQEKRSVMLSTQMDILSRLSPEERRRMMASMDKAMMGGS